MPRLRTATVAIDAFVGVTAIAGGIALAAGLEQDRFPLSWLRGTPFRDYTLPGIILAGVVGGSAAVAALLTLRSPRSGGTASMVAGAALIGWIAGEVILLRRPLSLDSLWEAFYAGAGGAMALLGQWRREATAPTPGQLCE